MEHEATRSAITIRSLDAADLPAFVALNNAAAPDMSLLDLERLEQMVGFGAMGCLIETEGRMVAAALWFDETGRGYDSPNYLWFRDRYARFTYVDRIIVAGTMRGRGLGQRIYQTVFAAATKAQSPVVTCEIYEKPPNPASRAFHEQLGFTIIGRQTIHNGERAVALMARPMVSIAG